MAISARVELRHEISTLSRRQCEQVLGFIQRISGPHCPNCYETDIDNLVWQDDEVTICCGQCGLCFDPSQPMVSQA